MELDDIRLAASGTLERLLPVLGKDSLSRLDGFLDAAARGSMQHSYKIYPIEAHAILDAYTKAGAGADVRAFLRAAIARRLQRTLDDDGLAHLPARVRTQQLAQFRRIAFDSDSGAEWLDLGHDLFHKEFGIAAVRLYVAGCQLVDAGCGIPRSLLLRGSPLDWLRNAAMMLSLGGHRPFFEIHAHKFMRELFGEEGRDECYRCCAELYALHPEVRGMIAGSWFYDPALEQVSPRLVYLRRVPLAGGAWLLFVNDGPDARANALATSPTRRRLFEEGKYLPKNYMIVWSKARQQAWARSSQPSSPIAV